MARPPGLGPSTAYAVYNGTDPISQISHCWLSLYDPVSGGYIQRGPYKVARCSTTGDVKVPNPLAGGQMIDVDERWWLPATSNVRPRSIVTDIPSGQTFSVIVTHSAGNDIECLVLRTQADS